MYYAKMPPDVAQHAVLLVDPMLATGCSAAMAVAELVRLGVPEENVSGVGGWWRVAARTTAPSA